MDASYMMENVILFFDDRTAFGQTVWLSSTESIKPSNTKCIRSGLTRRLGGICVDRKAFNLHTNQKNGNITIKFQILPTASPVPFSTKISVPHHLLKAPVRQKEIDVPILLNINWINVFQARYPCTSLYIPREKSEILRRLSWDYALHNANDLSHNAPERLLWIESLTNRRKPSKKLSRTTISTL